MNWTASKDLNPYISTSKIIISFLLCLPELLVILIFNHDKCLSRNTWYKQFAIHAIHKNVNKPGYLVTKIILVFRCKSGCVKASSDHLCKCPTLAMWCDSIQHHNPTSHWTSPLSKDNSSSINPVQPTLVTIPIPCIKHNHQTKNNCIEADIWFKSIVHPTTGHWYN